jgi:hypothetical protein
MSAQPVAPEPPVAPPIRHRGWLEVRWRQLRNPPRPVFRAVASSLIVAVAVGLLYLAYDVALNRGARLPGGDMRAAALVAYVALVLMAGATLTYLLVPRPTGSGPREGPGRSGWSAALGLFAALPIAYLVLVVLVQVVEPLLP